MGPYPDIEEGVELDFAKLKLGSIDMASVLAHEAKLQE